MYLLNNKYWCLSLFSLQICQNETNIYVAFRVSKIHVYAVLKVKKNLFFYKRPVHLLWILHRIQFGIYLAINSTGATSAISNRRK